MQDRNNSSSFLCFLSGFLTIGISSITRPSGTNYLVKTIELLIDNLSEEDRKEVFVVIFLADFNEAHKSAALAELSNGLKKYIEQDLLHVIFAPRDYYPPLSNLDTKFNDSQERIFWRSKLVVDFAFLMCYCKDLSQYYLHLEDDLIPGASFYPKLRNFIASQKNPWPILDAALMGHTAKVYHSSDLENIATYFYIMYNEMPVDWLLEFWRKIKYDRKYYKDLVLPPASLFQHIGDNSSFKGNKDSYKSKEKFFDEYDVKYKGLNPPAIISSSMPGTNPEQAYNKGSGHFWVMAKKDDFIIIEFTSATVVRQVFVDTGSYLAPLDLLKLGVLQASFQDNGRETEANGVVNCKGFETIGNFKDGRIKVSLSGNRKVNCLRILVTGDQKEWIFFREIDVWQA